MAMPESLYASVVRHIAQGFVPFKLSLSEDNRPQLTAEMKFDVCLELYRMTKAGSNEALAHLKESLLNIDVFLSFLQLGHKRIDLHKMFETVNSSSLNTLPQMIADAFVEQLQTKKLHHHMWLATMGHHLSLFLMDGGWYPAAASVLIALKTVMKNALSEETLRDIDAKLLHAYSEFRQLNQAAELLPSLTTGITGEKGSSYILCELSNHFFWRSIYQDAFKWGMQAVKSVQPKTPMRVVIDVLRQAGNLVLIIYI